MSIYDEDPDTGLIRPVLPPVSDEDVTAARERATAERYAALERMEVWQAPSGRLHLRQGCSGGAPRNRMRRLRISREEFDAATRCRCLSTWRVK